ncbi:hypothetical protein ACTXT7_009348 [Hymenolepis weldensis]
MFADRVVIPSALKRPVSQQLNSGHPGVKRMKFISRISLYWSGMTRVLKQLSKDVLNASKRIFYIAQHEKQLLLPRLND